MIDFAGLSLRDYILIAATLVGGYLLLSLVPLLRLGKKPRKAAAGRQAAAAPLGAWVPVEPRLPIAGQGGEPQAPQQTPQQTPQQRPYGDVEELSVDAPSSGFAHDLAYSSMDLEIRRMRHEIGTMRSELGGIAEELRQLKATRNVAPIYSEAMTLAQHGEAPAGIAAQCGISVGEAELVAALVRSGKEGEFDGTDADDRYRGAGS